MSDDLILYDFPGSPCARRVRITLLEKGLRWRTQTIDLSRLEQRDPRYLAINPNGLVPALAHGSRVLWESNVITEYLDDVFPETPLYPAEPLARVAVKQWQAAELQMAKDYRPLMYQRLMGPAIRVSRSLEEALAIARRSTSDPADLAWEEKVWRLQVLTPREEAETEERLYAWLGRLDHALADCDWLVGDGFGQAEISLYPRVAMFPYVGLAIDDRFPNVRRWMAALAERPSFTATLSRQERRMAAFAASPALKLVSSGLKKTAGRTWAERAAIFAVGRLLRFAEREQLADRPRETRPLLTPATDAPAKAHPRRRVRLATMDRFELLDVPARPESRQIKVALEQLGLPYRVASDGPPQGSVRLRHGDRELAEASLILEVLDACAPAERALFPSDAFDAARVRMWIAFDAAMHKEFEPLYRHFVAGDEHLAAGEIARMHAILSGRLDRVESELRAHAWICGDKYTIADAVLAARFDAFPRFGLDPCATRPMLRQWAARSSAATSRRAVAQ